MAGPATGFKVGDVITSLATATVLELVNRWAPYYPASNQAARLRDIARGLTRGDCSSVRAGVRREDQVLTVTAQRMPLTYLSQTSGSTHALAGEKFSVLSFEVASLKLSTW